MREYKFRAWDINSEVMYFSDRECVGGCNGNDPIIWQLSESGIYVLGMDMFDREVGGEHEQSYGYSKQECKIMQFTGLLDKNGKEIYEGDIVYKKAYGKESFMKVQWNNRFACFCCTYDMCGFPVMHFETVEVVGNIYENKELLK